jgi:hypothetical protein
VVDGLDRGGFVCALVKVLVHALNLVRRGDRPVDPAAVATMLGHALDELRLTLDS